MGLHKHRKHLYVKAVMWPQYPWFQDVSQVPNSDKIRVKWANLNYHHRQQEESQASEIQLRWRIYRKPHYVREVRFHQCRLSRDVSPGSVNRYLEILLKAH